MRKTSLFRLFKNKYFIIFVVIVLLLITYYSTRGSSALVFQSTTASIGSVVEKVSVTGAISPMSKADLSFEKSGVISKIYLKIGDKVTAGAPIATLENAGDRAAVAAAQANLDEVSRALRPEEYAKDQATIDAAATTLANAQKDAINAIHTGYVQAESAIQNYSDSFFTNPQSMNPTINIFVQSTPIQNAINNERVMVTEALNAWKKISNDNNTLSAQDAISATQKHVTTIKNFLNHLSTIVNDLGPGGSSLSQTTINSYLSTMNASLSAFNQAVTTVSSADTAVKNASSAYTQAKSNFTLQQAGSSPETIAAAAAKVAQAQAILAQDTITSPIDGIVTKITPNVGEFAIAGQSGFAVQNDGFKIEAFVPEADIAKVSLGDLASSTLDAYGSYVDFPAKVILIDPAETILEGIPTYKVTLQFTQPDPRIRSGMTANLEILTHEVNGALQIPYRALTITAKSTTVRLVNKDNKTFTTVPVVTGLKGSEGAIEIVSGLKEGDKVVTYMK